ncbi:MAG: hypothetical protein HKN01_01455 [Acidimicrobiia bacterium]|nr:hypothetical protein [Acidimicrobiia bacterium]
MQEPMIEDVLPSAIELTEEEQLALAYAVHSDEMTAREIGDHAGLASRHVTYKLIYSLVERGLLAENGKERAHKRWVISDLGRVIAEGWPKPPNQGTFIVQPSRARRKKPKKAEVANITVEEANATPEPKPDVPLMNLAVHADGSVRMRIEEAANLLHLLGGAR